MSSPANVNDITARFPTPLTTAQGHLVQALLEDSYAILLASDPTIADRITGSAPLRALVIQVQAAMITRVLRNPDGKLEESVDDYSYRRDSSVSTGALYVSDAELALLSIRRRRRGSFSIVLSS